MASSLHENFLSGRTLTATGPFVRINSVNRYLVILPDDSKIPPDLIEKTFQYSHAVRDTRRTWIVASNDLTCWDICSRLRIADESDPSNLTTGIVLKIDEINGYADATLWQNLRAWAALGND